jgi:hypothetical protein
MKLHSMMLGSLNKQSKLLAFQALITTVFATHPGWIFHPQTNGFTSGGLVSFTTI